MEKHSVESIEVTVTGTEDTIVIDPSESWDEFLSEVAPMLDSSPEMLTSNYKIQYVTKTEKMAMILNNSTYQKALQMVDGSTLEIYLTKKPNIEEKSSK